MDFNIDVVTSCKGSRTIGSFDARGGPFLGLGRPTDAKPGVSQRSYSLGALDYEPRKLPHAACRRFAGSVDSRVRDVVEAGDGHDLVATQEDPGTVAADAEPDGVVNVDLTGGRAVAEVVQVGVGEFQELAVVISPGSPGKHKARSDRRRRSVRSAGPAGRNRSGRFHRDRRPRHVVRSVPWDRRGRAARGSP